MGMPTPFDHFPALRLQAIAERLHNSGDAGNPPSFLPDFLRRIGRDDLPLTVLARTFDQLDQALQKGALSQAGSSFVHAYLTGTAPRQLERLQILSRELQANGGDDAELHAMVKRLRTGPWVDQASEKSAARMLDSLDLRRATRALRQPGSKLAAVASRFELRPVAKRPLYASPVLPASKRLPAVRISQLTAPDGTAVAWVSSTLARGGYSKFKPAILADGRVLGLRMGRTQDKAASASRRTNTHALEPHQYISERDALVAVKNRYTPITTLVDQQGRLYELVPLADGDMNDLTRTLDAPTRARILPVALDHLLGDVARVAEAGLSHRDIKPGNVMWERDGTFALADFGFAHDGPIRDARGTPEYMAPELFDGRQPVGNGVDVWAVGLTAVELLIGAPAARQFPLSIRRNSLSDPQLSYANYQAQATAMRANYAAWRAGVGRNPPPPMSPAVAAIDAAYQQVTAADPRIADLLFFHLLNPDAAQRPSAAAAQAQLHHTVPAAQRAPTDVAQTLAHVADEGPAGLRRKQVIDALERERKFFLGLR